MAIKLNGDVFDKTPILGVGPASYEDFNLPKYGKLKGINAAGNYQWCVDRCEKFQRMTQGKGKPMVYGSMKKDKRQ